MATLTTTFQQASLIQAYRVTATLQQSNGDTGLTYSPGWTVQTLYQAGTGPGQANYVDGIGGTLAVGASQTLDFLNWQGTNGFPVAWQSIKEMFIQNTGTSGNDLILSVSTYPTVQCVSLFAGGTGSVIVPPGGAIRLSRPGNGFQIAPGASQFTLSTLTPLANPTAAPTLSTTNSGGTIPPGTYQVGYTELSQSGETLLSPLASITVPTTTSTNTITMTANTSPAGNIYMSDANGVMRLATYVQSDYMVHGATITAPASTNAAAAPTANTTGASAPVSFLISLLGIANAA